MESWAKLFKDYRKSFGFSSSTELSANLIMLDKQDSIFIYWLLDVTEARLDDMCWFLNLSTADTVRVVRLVQDPLRRHSIMWNTSVSAGASVCVCVSTRDVTGRWSHQALLNDVCVFLSDWRHCVYSGVLLPSNSCLLLKLVLSNKTLFYPNTWENG